MADVRHLVCNRIIHVIDAAGVVEARISPFIAVGGTAELACFEIVQPMTARAAKAKTIKIAPTI